MTIVGGLQCLFPLFVRDVVRQHHLASRYHEHRLPDELLEYLISAALQLVLLVAAHLSCLHVADHLLDRLDELRVIARSLECHESGFVVLVARAAQLVDFSDLQVGEVLLVERL